MTTNNQILLNNLERLGLNKIRTWVRQDPRFDHKIQVKPPIPKPEIPVNVRMKAIEELYERRDSARNIAKRYNVSRTRLYSWKEDLVGKDIPAKAGALATQPVPSEDAQQLQRRVHELELQNDILTQVNELLKKDLGIDYLHLTN